MSAASRVPLASKVRATLAVPLNEVMWVIFAGLALLSAVLLWIYDKWVKRQDAEATDG